MPRNADSFGNFRRMLEFLVIFVFMWTTIRVVGEHARTYRCERTVIAATMILECIHARGLQRHGRVRRSSTQNSSAIAELASGVNIKNSLRNE